MAYQISRKTRIISAVFVLAAFFSPCFGISETNQETVPAASVTATTPEPSNPEARQILQHELKVLMEERRTMVDNGAKASEITDITKKIQEKSKTLSSQPPLVSQMSAEAQKTFDQEFLMRKAKLDELGNMYKTLISKTAPKEEIEAIVKQINEARSDMQRFVQTSMQPVSNANPQLPSQAVDDHSGH